MVGTTCAFTGHRPHKFPWKDNEADPRCIALKETLAGQIAALAEDGVTEYFTGGADGTDCWAAEIVLALRDEGAAVRLICTSPYRGFENRWSREWQARYRRVMERADLVRFICPGYSRDCFQRRNEWMVDHSARVIAVYNGQPSGTRNTIEYAKRCSVPVVLLPR